jgi:hypothetical protein
VIDDNRPAIVQKPKERKTKNKEQGEGYELEADISTTANLPLGEKTEIIEQTNEVPLEQNEEISKEVDVDQQTETRGSNEENSETKLHAKIAFPSKNFDNFDESLRSAYVAWQAKKPALHIKINEDAKAIQSLWTILCEKAKDELLSLLKESNLDEGLITLQYCESWNQTCQYIVEKKGDPSPIIDTLTALGFLLFADVYLGSKTTPQKKKYLLRKISIKQASFVHLIPYYLEKPATFASVQEEQTLFVGLFKDECGGGEPYFKSRGCKGKATDQVSIF